MLQRLKSNQRIQYLIISLTLALITSILSVAAYLTDETEPFSASLKMRYGRSFGITISSDSYKENSDIIPGETVAFDPYLSNNGNYDAYVFMELLLPDKSFIISELNSNWVKLDSTTNKNIYYYGSSSKLTALAAQTKDDNGNMVATNSSPLCNGITLKSSTDLKQDDYTIQAIGYAIQIDEADESSPADVWKLLGEGK